MIQLALVRVTFVAKHHDKKKIKLRKKGFVWLDILNQSPLREAEARNQTRLEPGGRDEPAVEESSLLAYSLWLV